MADVELFIKIDEEVYKKAKETHDVMCDSVWLSIKHGKLLPKGHGRIIDESQVTGTFAWDNAYIECFAPTIIEADKDI